MGLFGVLHELFEPVLPGLVAAGVSILVLLLSRLVFREPALKRKLRLPVNLLLVYLVLIALLVGVQRYVPVVRGPLHLAALFVLALAIILAVSFGLFDLFLGRYRKVHLPAIVRDIAVLVVYALTIIIVLSRHGVNLTSIVTTSAVLTAVIGFALQDLLSNIISGIALQLEQPFKTDDWVMFDEQEGRVLEINWRSTKIQTLHNDIVVIPNNVITRAPLINLSSPTPIHRRKLKIGLRYETPPNEAKASILKAVRSVAGVLEEPEPYVLLRGYDDCSIGYRIHFFIEDIPRKDRIEDEVYTRIWYQLKRDGHSIPFPIRDVNLREVATEEEHQRERERAELDRFLRNIPLLQPLSSDERNRLAPLIRRERFGAGETIIHVGEPGDCLYIMASGQVDVFTQEDLCVGTLTEGSYFGEMSLMTGETRSATVVATVDCELYIVDKAAFEAVLVNNEALVDTIVAQLQQRRDELAVSQRGRDGERLSAVEIHASLVSRIRRFFNLG